MGRPLNKKYFGNRNVGSSSTTADNKIGGEGIASINWSQVGSWLSSAGGAAAPLAGLALPAPTLPGGVQATWTNYFGAAAVTTGAGSVGLVVGETYEYAPIPGLVVTVATSTNNGTNATFTVTNAGSTTNLLTDLTGVTLTRKTGSGAATFLVDIALKIVDTVINEKGSGYTGAETFTVALANSATGTAPAGTIVLTTDSGAAGSATNQENAILAYAFVPAVNGGTQRLVADIVKQTNDKRYKVKTSEGTGICQLKTSGIVNAAGEMTIKATDQAGKTYFVAKLTSRKAVLVPYGTSGHQFSSGASVKWTFGAAVAPSGSETGVVTIENV
jgi:hypothetical protein